MQPTHIGGSFAPPLSDDKLDEYTNRIESLPTRPVKDACATLLTCCKTWWDLPEPEGTASWAHPSGRGTIVNLQPDHAQALDEHIPWAHELQAIQQLLDGIDPVAECDLRNMAFLLLWHVKELDRGRE